MWNIRHIGRRPVIAPDLPPRPERNDRRVMPSARHCCGQSSRKLPALSPGGILSPCHYERNHGGKAFFTILNCLLTITNVAPRLGNADHGCQDEAAYRQMIDALKTLK